MAFGLEQEGGSLITPMAHPLYSIKADRVLSATTCGLDGVFPHDDLGSGLFTQFIFIHIKSIIAVLYVIKISSL